MALSLGPLLLEQLTWHWDAQLRPKLDGLTDEEYLWEPVAGCWSLRRRSEARTSMAAGGGEWVLDFAYPEPDPAPVSTIAWRLGHVLVGLFGMRNAAHFGGPPIDYQSAVYSPDAAGALRALDQSYERWKHGVAGLDDAELAEPIGPAEGPFAEFPYAALIAHINREVIHHGAEILLLRDLYRASNGAALGDPARLAGPGGGGGGT
jgi:hypothetical protein